MSRINYSLSLKAENTARAMGYELHISPRHAVEICNELRKRPVPEAKKILEDVIGLRRSIPFKRFNKGVGHRSDAPGAGRYPRKAAREILKVIKDAEGNASYKGLSPEKMIIRHIASKRGRVIKGMMPRAMGRATAKNVETVTVEAILESTEVKKKE
jgi:large subunit ribosomal protein L22